MNKAECQAALSAVVKEKVLTDVPMRKHTTWQIGGPADIMVFPSSEEELAAVFKIVRERDLPWLVVGNGSNLLVGDKGVRGVVIKMGAAFSASVWKGDQVEACAGMLLSALALEAADRSLAGLEFARGIPGSIGGAVRMNAGAYGSNIGSYVQSVHAVGYDGEQLDVAGEDISFAYRDSSLFQLDAVITRVSLRLYEGDKEQILAQIKDYSQRRSFAQPLEFPSCGSVFRNPAFDHAGRLIEMAGLRGFNYGGAGVSKKHGNFIINLGGARACDVRELIEEIQRRVFEYSGVQLEPEVKFVGEF
ncbi:MAG: UDP-N-acetylmuramate dehydrogenase [Bacillota bacterium]|nr:UDP-N-acetylmuramate dehydrogenase [Bacillota bacterium]